MPDQIASGDETNDGKGHRQPLGVTPSTDLRHNSPQEEPPNPGNSNSNTDNQQTSIIRATWFQAVFTFLILLVNIGYVWVATQQFGAMNAQVGVIRDQVATMQMQNSIISNEFNEMKVQSSFMKEQLIALET
jgi:hypothetical protein